MRRTAAFLLSLLLSGCASNRYTPEPIHPSPERMQELLNAPIPTVKAKAIHFELQASPAIAMVGQDVTLTCYVPSSYGNGAIRLSVEGLQTQVFVLASQQTRMTVPRIGCGVWRATCHVKTDSVDKQIERTIEVRGGMCEGN